ncbi:MAG: TatD family hydrolase [Paludibacterium sp.]|uniref:TatD family hydrolase n=1 Tax=Paludibacterium sp. TaxID=1917523 RepID=UPI0025FBB5EE|nr:TatD family hydrolase [Paludibacterium sp.]MBV8049036.1 TatD family hydrolase [Paludibacterium sp.]MBV8646067.1 TatD family hydrolase [Paludibacterium sp.]
MLVDSHCHLNFPDLVARLPEALAAMRAAAVSHALVIGVALPDFPSVLALAEAHDNLWATVGVHPDNPDAVEPTREQLVELARHPRVVGIGETGLDYHWCQGDLTWQHERFRTHIRAARECGLPLVVHTRESVADTLRLLAEEHAGECGGVMHCFTEDWESAKRALDLGMHISISGIVTFKNAGQVRDVASKVPLDRLLVETDSPYLAPVPYRGKQNQPAYVRHVAECIADLRGMPFEQLAAATSANFFRLFAKALPVKAEEGAA